MKVLLYSWDAYSERGLYKALGEMGHKVLIYSKKIKNHLMDEEFLTELALLLVQERVELVISYDFFPMVSMACRAAHIKYASWIFGTPHYSLYCDAVFYEGNYIFCFDYMQYQMVQRIGAAHVYHLPLAVEPALFEASIRERKVRPVGDVSFVGMLYTGDGNYFEQIAEMPDYMKGYIEGLCEAQLKVYG